jgi:hypothetical protein
VRVGPASGNQFSVPAQQRRRSHEERVPQGTTQHPGQRGEQDSIGRLKIRSVDLTAQYRDLVAQHQDLDLLGAVTPQHQDDKLEGASQREIGKGPEHGR